jgi:hypothetical protein
MNSHDFQFIFSLKDSLPLKPEAGRFRGLIFLLDFSNGAVSNVNYDMLSDVQAGCGKFQEHGYF